MFKCPQCSFWASTASRFHVHIVTHLNRKPFECSLCSYRSNWGWDVGKHIRLKKARDPDHENAKVLMTDETGRRNYTKYNKYLVEMKICKPESETNGTKRAHSATKSNAASNLLFDRQLSYPTLEEKKFDLPTSLGNSADASTSCTNVGKNNTKKFKGDNGGKKTIWKCKKCTFRLVTDFIFYLLVCLYSL